MSLDKYDAGILPSFESASVEWWQDYVRAELARAHSFYEGIHNNMIDLLKMAASYVDLSIIMTKDVNSILNMANRR